MVELLKTDEIFLINHSIFFHNRPKVCFRNDRLYFTGAKKSMKLPGITSADINCALRNRGDGFLKPGKIALRRCKRRWTIVSTDNSANAQNKRLLENGASSAERIKES